MAASSSHEIPPSAAADEDAATQHFFVMLKDSAWGAPTQTQIAPNLCIQQHVQCIVCLYKGDDISDVHLARNMAPHARGEAVLVPGGGPGCVIVQRDSNIFEENGMCEEIGRGFSCFGCKDLFIIIIDVGTLYRYSSLDDGRRIAR